MDIPQTIYHGLPQGSVLSPILFNLYSGNIHTQINNLANCIQYADEFCIYSIQNTYDDCICVLENIMQAVLKWTEETGMTLSTEKCSIMFFTRHRLRAPESLTLCGRTMAVVNEYKYLGIILDTKLLCSKHVLHIHNKCEKD